MKERSRINDNFLTAVELLSQMSTHASGAPGVLECIAASRPMMCFRLFRSFIKLLLTGILSDAEVLLIMHLALNRITYPIGVVRYGVEIVSGFLDGLRPRTFGRWLLCSAA